MSGFKLSGWVVALGLGLAGNSSLSCALVTLGVPVLLTTGFDAISLGIGITGDVWDKKSLSVIVCSTGWSEGQLKPITKEQAATTNVIKIRPREMMR
jgi:flavorubredoxin